MSRITWDKSSMIGNFDISGNTIKVAYEDRYDGKINNIITGNELISKLGITQGTQVTTGDITWLKFMTEDGEELLVADRNIRRSISYDHLESVGVVKTLSSGYDPSQQGKIIDIDGKQYKVRLLTGGNDNPAASAGGEWDRLIVKFTPDNADSNWSAVYTWCVEVRSGLPGGRVIRGINSVVHFTSNTSALTGANLGFRPVLVAL